MNKLILSIVCFFIVTAIFLFGLWPLNFHPKNEVEWLKDRDGIHFYGRGIIYSSELLKGQNQIFFQNNSISIEIYLQPAKERYRSIAYILSLNNGKGTEYFTIGQWEKTLIVLGSRIIDTMRIESVHKIWLGNALPTGEVQFITLSSDSEGTAIYINGRLAKFYPTHSLISEKQLTNAQLVLGNSPTGKYPWNGNIFGLAIYNRSLRQEEVFQHYQSWLKDDSVSLLDNENLASLFLFNEQNGTLVHDRATQRYDLILPATFHVLHKTVLKLPWIEFWLGFSYFTDLIINVAGFIPFGFFISIFLFNIKQISLRRIFIITILLGGGISLIIELIQVYLPTRSSSLKDLICNVLGTFMGVTLFRKLNQELKNLSVGE